MDLSRYEEITDLDFSAEGSHLAVCSKFQGGSANRVHQALVLKSEDLDDHTTLASVQLLKSLSQEIDVSLIEKAGMSYENIKLMLTDVIRDTYGECAWVADFTDKVVIFMDEGIYYAQPYKHRKGTYNLMMDRANVVECKYWELDPNNVVDEDTKKALQSGSDIVITKSNETVLASVCEGLFDLEKSSDDLSAEAVLAEIREDVEKAKKDKLYKEDDDDDMDDLEDEDDDDEDEDDDDHEDDDDRAETNELFKDYENFIKAKGEILKRSFGEKDYKDHASILKLIDKSEDIDLLESLL